MDTTGGEMDGKTCLPENPRQRGRKKLKPNEKKTTEKKPMRGMGVAKLERLRLTGHQKSPPPIPQPPPILPSGHHFFLPAPADPARAAGYGYLDLNNALLLQRLGSAQVRVGFGGIMDVGLRRGGPSYPGENSKELSSIPNPVRYPADQCCFCHKKTRVNGGSLGCNGMRENFCDPSLINGFSFNGFNVGNKQPTHGSIVDKEVEAVDIHRNESSSRAFMEYDFFPPGKGGRGTCSNDLDLSLCSSEASVAALGGGDQGSCVTTTTASASSGFDASTSIDLSLKLYC